MTIRGFKEPHTFPFAQIITPPQKLHFGLSQIRSHFLQEIFPDILRQHPTHILQVELRSPSLYFSGVGEERIGVN